MVKVKIYHQAERKVKVALSVCPFPIFLFCLFIFIPNMAEAQKTIVADSVIKKTVTQLQDLSKQVDDKLVARYYKTRYDTNYVDRPYQKWLLRFLVNHTGNNIHTKGTVNGLLSDHDLHTSSASLSLEVNYCDVSVSLSIRPDNKDDYVFNFEYYGQRFSVNFNYQRAKSLTGDVVWGDTKHIGDKSLLMKVYDVAAYYTFNNRQFSFPAALNQNYFQRRSAGSWLAGISLQTGSIKTTDEMKKHSPEAPETHLTFTNFGIGGGYGYNWVPDRQSQWLLHLSALPTFVVYKQNKLSVNDYEVKENNLGFNMILNNRAAVVYHISPRYNVGATFTMSTPLFNNDKVVVNQTKWLLRAFFGLRL